MKFRHLSILAIVLLLIPFSIVACGDEGGDVTVEDVLTTRDDTGTTSTTAGDGTADEGTDSEGATWIGVWNIVTDNGSPPAANGYNSLILTLTASTYTSEYNSDAANCTWSGTHTSTPTTLTITTAAATGPPCDQALGKTRTAQLTLSADGNTLTLDWTAETMGTLQVYQRTS